MSGRKYLNSRSRISNFSPTRHFNVENTEVKIRHVGDGFKKLFLGDESGLKKMNKEVNFIGHIAGDDLSHSCVMGSLCGDNLEYSLLEVYSLISLSETICRPCFYFDGRYTAIYARRLDKLLWPIFVWWNDDLDGWCIESPDPDEHPNYAIPAGSVIVSTSEFVEKD